MNDLVKTEETMPAVGFSNALEKAIDAGATAETIHSLIDAQERVMSKQAEMDFNAAMARLQPKLPEIKRSAKGHNSKYAKYEAIDREVRPLYTAEGFSIDYNSKRNGDEITYYGTISHQAGHSKTAEIDLPADESGKKNPIQAKGSTISYAKRYLIGMLLNIVTVDEDDDGHKGGSELLTEEEAKRIKDLLAETQSDVKAFLGLWGYPDVDSADRRDFRKMQTQLITKRQLLETQAAATELVGVADQAAEAIDA